jgi:O-antigen/teichoic acid export membrane protein
MWIVGGMVLNNGIRLFSNLLLTRLLAPDLYGLMSVGNVMVSALVLLSDIGLVQSVMQNPRGEEPRFLNTVWSVRIVRGFILSTILLLIAGALTSARTWAPGLVQGTYGDPRLVTILLVLAIFPIVDGFESTNLSIHRRHVQLRAVVLTDVVAQVAATVLMLLIALWRPAVWVLPAGWVCSSLIRTALSYAISGPGNRPAWDRSIASEIWHFSKWILISSSLTFAYRDGDRFVLGGLFNASEMGLYGVSILLLAAAKQVVSSLSGSIGMPALAQVARTRPHDLAQAYRRCRLPIDLICLGTGGLMFGAADLIIRCLYDARYQGAAPIFQLLALILVAHRYIVFDDFLVATGNTRQLFKRGVLQIIVLVVVLPLGYHLGAMRGAVIGVLAANFSVVPLILFLEWRAGVFNWRAELKVLPMFVLGAAVGHLLNGIHIH